MVLRRLPEKEPAEAEVGEVGTGGQRQRTEHPHGKDHAYNLA